ncbi:unnamed protein product [Rotaria magnacalcarata]|uniref:Uncharacterized protein n=1 Tax=Rotaria magnacalcarata TaxID=392030 RepID=A0A8S2JFD3_9BILA|nr:unnamed protein product [Rotaria magnacalcarata]
MNLPHFYWMDKNYPVEQDLNSFINTSRIQRANSLMVGSAKSSVTYPGANPFETRSEINFSSGNPLRTLSPDDITKMKYKIELDKQVAEKKERRAREWETKIEREKKYVRHQPFGQHGNTTILNTHELEEILAKGRGPSPVLDMPQQLPLNYPQSYMQNGNNMYDSPHRLIYNYSPPYSNYSNGQTKPLSPQKHEPDPNNFNFHGFYGPHGNGNNDPSKQFSSASSASNGTAQPIKGDAHDPFLLFDPNKEGQNVFNIIPQQDLYDPWGRPGGGAPLIHPPTGQKFTRYSGSLQEKLNKVGPLGFDRRHYSGNIDEQKRDLEVEHRRRQQEEMEHRSNAGDTAEWISQLESSRYPLKLHLPTTQTTREYIGARDRYRSEESRSLHNDLVRQADERYRNQQIHRYHNSIAELQHTEAQNSWWGRSGGGAPSITNRRHNVQATLETPRQRFTTNHLGQLVVADDGPSSQVKVYDSDYYYPKIKGFSSHRNFYQAPEDKRL